MEGTGFGAANLCCEVLHFNVANCRGPLMYLGGPNVKRYAPRVRHVKRGGRTRARVQIEPILLPLCVKIQFFEIGNGWYDGRHRIWGPEPILGRSSFQCGTL